MAGKMAQPNTALSSWQLTKLCKCSKCLNMSEFIFHRKSVGNTRILTEASEYSSTIFFCVKICQSAVWEIGVFHYCNAKPQTGASPVADPDIIVLDPQ